VPQPDLHGLPDWVKSLGLPAEAAAAIDRYWRPVWDALRDELGLLPELPRRPPEIPGTEQLEFEAVREHQPGAAWKARFDAMWPAYRAWYLKDGDAARPDYSTCRRALERHMPELVATYEAVVELAGGGDLAARLLSLYRPPGFVVGCSQGAWTRGAPVLARNYDYPVSRLEGIVCLTAWKDRRVIGMSDCLWGLLDGVNDAGLAVSLTFGGRREVGDGFAIPLVVRCLLETCADDCPTVEIPNATGELGARNGCHMARGPIARVFLGSRATKIVRHSPVPVMVVPRGVVAELADEAVQAETGHA
jgi:hypothetical protein